MLLIASALQVLLFYHLAVLFGLAGAVVAYRAAGPIVLRRLWIFILSSAAVGLIQVTFLASRPGSVVKLVGALVGQPSVWPYVRISQFSLCATVLAFCATVWGLWRVANRQRAPDYALLALLGLWIPMFVLGLFVWDMPARYAAASLLPMLLSAFALVQYAFDWLAQRSFGNSSLRTCAPSSCCSRWRWSWSRRRCSPRSTPPRNFPDHRAQLNCPQPEHHTRRHPDRGGCSATDLLSRPRRLLAVQPQARPLVRTTGRRRDPRLLYQYACDRQRRAAAAGPGHLRRPSHLHHWQRREPARRASRDAGLGIFEVLKSDRLEEVYLGNDGTTKVWRARPGGWVARMRATFTRILAIACVSRAVSRAETEPSTSPIER